MRPASQRSFPPPKVYCFFRYKSVFGDTIQQRTMFTIMPTSSKWVMTRPRPATDSEADDILAHQFRIASQLDSFRTTTSAPEQHDYPEHIKVLSDSS